MNLKTPKVIVPILMGILLAGIAVLNTCCTNTAVNSALSGLAVTPSADGVVLITKTTPAGQTYAAGVGFNKEGDVALIRTAWTNTNGIELMADYVLATKATTIKYKKGGAWLGWNSATGIVLDNAPPTVVAADPPLPITPAVQ